MWQGFRDQGFIIFAFFIFIFISRVNSRVNYLKSYTQSHKLNMQVLTGDARNEFQLDSWSSENNPGCCLYKRKCPAKWQEAVACTDYFLVFPFSSRWFPSLQQWIYYSVSYFHIIFSRCHAAFYLYSNQMICWICLRCIVMQNELYTYYTCYTHILYILKCSAGNFIVCWCLNLKFIQKTADG